MMQEVLEDEAGNLWVMDAQGQPVPYTEPQPQTGPHPFTVGTPRPKDPPAAPSGYRWTGDGDQQYIPGGPADPHQRPLSATEIDAAAKEQGGKRRAETIRAITGRVRDLYKQDIQGQPASRLWGATEYIDRIPSNERFTSAGRAMLGLLRPLVAQSAKEGDSDKEMEAFLAYVPSADDSDKTIEEKLSMLEVLIGGMVDGKSATETMMAFNNGEIEPPAALRNEGDIESGPVGSQDIGGPGGMSPDEAARQGADIDAFGRGAADLLTLGGANKLAAAMNTIVPLDNLFGAENQSIWGGQSLRDAYRHNIGLQNRTDDADENVNAGARLAGQLAGGVAGTYGAMRLAPKALVKANAMLAPRAVAADAAMGATYEGNKAIDRGQPILPAAAKGGALWAAGGAGGRAAANVVGRAVSGITNSSARNLHKQGIPLTIGQMASGSGIGVTGMNLSGRALKAVDDVIAGSGVLSGGVTAQREAGMEAFNRAAFNQGLAPIGRTVDDVGEAGIMQAKLARSAGYSDALDNVHLTADLPFAQSLNKIAKSSDNIKGMEGEFRATLKDRVGSQFNMADRTMDGRDMQAAIRGLRKDAEKADRNSNFIRSDKFGEAARAVERELLNLAEKRNPGVAAKFAQANKANMNYEILRDAVRSGKNKEGLFTPAQLRTAADRAAEKFGRNGGTTNVPFYQLTKDGQKVLPSKIPDNGSPGRWATLSLPWAATGTYGVAENRGWTPSGGTAALAALALASSPAGRKVAEKALMSRPKPVREMGKNIRKKTTLFGSVFAPVPVIASD